MRKPKENEQIEVIPYVSTFNPKNPEFYSLIHNHLSILNTDPKMKKVINEKKVIKSKRQPKNLKKLLTRAKYTEEDTETPTVKKCLRPNCGTCPHIMEKNTFEFKNNLKFKIKCNMDCSCKEVIYVITCNGCQEHYIGQTQELRKRVTVHKQQIRQQEYEQIPLSRHIRICAKNKNPNFYIFPFYKFFHKSTESERIIKENKFIHIFKPRLNAL